MSWVRVGRAGLHCCVVLAVVAICGCASSRFESERVDQLFLIEFGRIDQQHAELEGALRRGGDRGVRACYEQSLALHQEAWDALLDRQKAFSKMARRGIGTCGRSAG